MNEQQNLILAIAMSVAILIGFQLFYEGPRQKQAEQQTQSQQQQPVTPQQTPSAAPDAPVAAPLTPKVRERAELVAEQAASALRLKITTPRVNGTINRTGARLDDLSLVDYHETPDPKSPEIGLLAPAGTEHPYYASSAGSPKTAPSPFPTPTRCGPPPPTR